MNITNSAIEEKFLRIALFFGCLLIFIIPPLQAPDENNHFKKAFLVSQLKLFPQSENGKVGNYLPQTIIDFENNHNYLISNINEKYSYEKLYINFAVPVSYDEKTFVEYSTSHTNPINYLPQAISMVITKLFFNLLSFGDLLTPITYLYAGRVGNLLFFVISIYYAMKMTPFFKNVLFILCAMPMTAFLASSLSYDVMVISISFLLIALFTKFAFDERVQKINQRQLIAIICLSIILIELKLVYYPLIFLFFLIPKDKLGSTRKYFSVFLMIFFSGIIFHTIWALFNSAMIVADGAKDSNAQQQFMFIITQPFDYFKILFESIIQLRFYYINSFVGNLGWLDTNIPFIFTLLYIPVIIFMAMVDSEENHPLKIRHKLIVVATFGIILLLVFTSLYIIWTSIPEVGGVGSTPISGVQGRYFIPIAPLGLMAFYSRIFKKKYINTVGTILRNHVPDFLLYSHALLLFILIIRYWV